MDVKIGIQHVAREVVVDTDLSSEEVTKAVTTALASGEPLVLSDAKGQQVIVPAAAIGYVDVAAELKSRVGFGG